MGNLNDRTAKEALTEDTPFNLLKRITKHQFRLNVKELRKRHSTIHYSVIGQPKYCPEIDCLYVKGITERLIFVLCTNTLKCRDMLTGHTDTVCCLALFKARQSRHFLISGGKDKMIIVWELTQTKPDIKHSKFWKIKTDFQINHFEFGPDILIIESFKKLIYFMRLDTFEVKQSRIQILTNMKRYSNLDPREMSVQKRCVLMILRRSGFVYGQLCMMTQRKDSSVKIKILKTDEKCSSLRFLDDFKLIIHLSGYTDLTLFCPMTQQRLSITKFGQYGFSELSRFQRNLIALFGKTNRVLLFRIVKRSIYLVERVRLPIFQPTSVIGIPGTNRLIVSKDAVLQSLHLDFIFQAQ